MSNAINKFRFDDVSLNLLGTLYNDAPCNSYYCIKEIIKDTLRIGWFKKIPLNWIIIDDNAKEPEIDVTADGVNVYLSKWYSESDKDYIKTAMKAYKNWIINLYKKSRDIEVLKGQIIKIADEVCSTIDASYTEIHLYSKENGDTTGYCDGEALYFSLDMMTMPYNVIYSVIAHECCHLKVRDHGDDFWELFHTVDAHDECNDRWFEQYGWHYYNYPPSRSTIYDMGHHESFRKDQNIVFSDTLDKHIIFN